LTGTRTITESNYRHADRPPLEKMSVYELLN